MEYCMLYVYVYISVPEICGSFALDVNRNNENGMELDVRNEETEVSQNWRWGLAGQREEDEGESKAGSDNEAESALSRNWA